LRQKERERYEQYKEKNFRHRKKLLNVPFVR
jgi:hypothetical protein